jgi:hypothetical protein
MRRAQGGTYTISTGKVVWLNEIGIAHSFFLILHKFQRCK